MVETAYRVAMDCGEIDDMASDWDLIEFLRLDSPAMRWQLLKRRFDDKYRKQMKKAHQVVPEDSSVALRENRTARGVEKTETLRPVNGVSKHFLRWFVLWHAYPRLDVNVSTDQIDIFDVVSGLNHLLKSPFCIHPKTGNVAVPLDVGKIHEFDVTTCPRVDILVNELSKTIADEDVKENRKILGYKHTSLAPYVENFEKFVALAVSS
ncbi:hypothetical protein TELCIR_14997 [Teladorsagia circumcincta]|uniref:Uncharacterized protein n=1 Tax=Teladorsagia circumcincta TaxID=45464 RepID=A0A2G9TZJ3_TELCI|nr:hypothetical protein TELCIR_14997 [Teladorsagia circumcincta]